MDEKNDIVFRVRGEPDVPPLNDFAEHHVRREDMMSYHHEKPWFVLFCKHYHRYFKRGDGTLFPFTHSYRIDVEGCDDGRVRVTKQIWWFTGAIKKSFTTHPDTLPALVDEMQKHFEEDMKVHAKKYEVKVVYELEPVNLSEMLAKITVE